MGLAYKQSPPARPCFSQHAEAEACPIHSALQISSRAACTAAQSLIHCRIFDTTGNTMLLPVTHNSTPSWHCVMSGLAWQRQASILAKACLLLCCTPWDCQQKKFVQSKLGLYGCQQQQQQRNEDLTARLLCQQLVASILTCVKIWQWCRQQKSWNRWS